MNAPQPPARKPAVIAGHNTGAKVTISPAHKPTLDNLVKMAKQGNYWALSTLKHMRSLTSGHIKDNIFVREDFRHDKIASYVMIVPGCKVSIMKRPNGEYLIYELQADTNYLELQKAGKRPGLYRVDKTANGWLTEHVSSGAIIANENRIVAISDSFNSPKHATAEAARCAANASISGGTTYLNSGFNLHFTPGLGSERLGGLRQLRTVFIPTSDSNTNESAVLLARTMAASRKTKGVRWISCGGGSKVLTQALSILEKQKIDFDNTNHYLHLSEPTTWVKPAQNLALSLNFKLERRPYNIKPYNVNQLAGGTGLYVGKFVTSYNRFRQDPEYTLLKLTSDTIEDLTPVKNAGQKLGLTTATIAGAVGLGATSGSFTAVLTWASAIGGAVGLGATIADAYFPNWYEKIKGKF